MMTARYKIGDAPNGEDTTADGTEKIPVTGSKYMLVSTIAAYIRTLTQTLTNKTINLASNTLTGTTAEFNTALSDGNFATLAGSEVLTNKTLTAPTIADFTNMAHDHGDADDGGSALASPTITTPTISGSITFPDNVRQTFNPGADAAGLNVGSIAGDPGTPSNGDIWYDSTANTLDARINGATVNLGAGSDSFKTIVVSGQSDVVADSATDTLTLVAGTNVSITTDATTDTLTFTASGGAGGGDVDGPVSATDNAITRFDGTTGKIIQNSAVTIDDTGIVSFPDNITQTFNPGADNAGINVGSLAGDPATPDNGDVWYDSTANELTARINGANVALSGGVTNAEYISSAAHASLSAEVVIPGLAGSADISGSGGAGVSYEFDSGASPLTWSTAVDTETVDSTFPSHLYIQDNGAAETLGTYSWSPAGAFDLRCKISVGAELGTSASGPGAGLIVGDSAMNNRCMMELIFLGSADTYEVLCYTYAASTYTQRGAVVLTRSNVAYMRITRDGSNNNSFYLSSDGITWILIATQALTYTAAKAGIRVAAASITTNVAVDWIRSDV